MARVIPSKIKLLTFGVFSTGMEGNGAITKADRGDVDRDSPHDGPRAEALRL
jgi:hypothetical protein